MNVCFLWLWGAGIQNSDLVYPYTGSGPYPTLMTLAEKQSAVAAIADYNQRYPGYTFGPVVWPDSAPFAGNTIPHTGTGDTNYNAMMSALQTGGNAALFTHNGKKKKLIGVDKRIDTYPDGSKWETISYHMHEINAEGIEGTIDVGYFDRHPLPPDAAPTPSPAAQGADISQLPPALTPPASTNPDLALQLQQIKNQFPALLTKAQETQQTQQDQGQTLTQFLDKLFGIDRNTTEMKQAEQQLKSTIDGLAEDISDAIGVFNPAASRIFDKIAGIERHASEAAQQIVESNNALAATLGDLIGELRTQNTLLSALVSYYEIEINQ